MPIVSALADRQIRYPERGDFSPSERYPEYRFDSVSSRPNPVYRAVRDCLAQARLDAGNLGTAAWNPFGKWVRPGQRVFVLCNFVQHRRPNETAENFAAKCIHGSVLRPLVDYLLIALGGQGEVAFGNAPLQSCEWPAVLADTGSGDVADFYRSKGLPVEPCDLRLYVTEQNLLGGIDRVERRDESAGSLINLGSKSKLAQVANGEEARFRLLDYDPRRTEAFHRNGNHQYVIHKRVLAADVILSLAKLKTHEKVGITCSLKGCVGAVAHKDCLAHHRLGTPATGGDEYPSDRLYVKRCISRFHDWVQQTRPDGGSGNVLRIIDRLLRSGLQRAVRFGHGSWSGNDTAWRMALDVARIVRYADVNGEMQNTPQREHLVFIDGIVGGQGDGPLKPTAKHRGLVLFADDPPMADYACAALMGFDPARIPLVRHAFAAEEFRLSETGFADGDIVCLGKPQSLSSITCSSDEAFEPPRGWRGAIERRLADSGYSACSADNGGMADARSSSTLQY